MTTECSFCNQYVCKTSPIQWEHWGKKYNQKNDVILTSENFIVVAGLGALIEGYTLLIPKTHRLSMAQLSREHFTEFILLKEFIGHLTRNIYGTVSFFEHGASIENKGGGCLDHAHLHISPLNFDLGSHLRIKLHEKLLVASDELLDYANYPYLYYESSTNQKYIYPLSERLESQFIRRIWAKAIDKPLEWDWAIFIGEEKVAETIYEFRNSISSRENSKYLLSNNWNTDF